ncbi:MAG TPA: tRNA lysidine(34) synthetase TilS [Vicinamibacterales bacterium]|nr:tRNA lysidine(34) synthetase TilS [Vicinamibacterales bacterium]
MSPLARRVLRGLRRRKLLSAGERVAVALSGGSDSVALAWLLREIASAGHLSVAGLVHLNHGLRGEESNADEAFCRALAARLGWPIDVERVDAGVLARARTQSVEVASRDARYQFFEAAARRLPADAVATGHTLDDQAETVLLRLLRGAGSRGLSGVRPRRGPYVRPLLEITRAELREYLAGIGESFRDDASNLDLTIPRNRIRHELMPVIARLAPGGSRALARLAMLARDDEDFLQQAAIAAGRSLVLSNRGVDRQALAALPPALGRRVARDLLLSVHPAAPLTSRHVEAVRELAAADKPNGHLDLPGLVVECRAGVLKIDRATDTPETDGPIGRERGLKKGAGLLEPLPLQVPGAVEMPKAGVSIAASIQKGAPRGSSDRGPGGKPGGDTMAVLQASSLALPLAVRSRRPGDRFRPLGAPGRRKLQDLLVDRKVPRDERDALPLVVDAADRIVWVVGVAIAEECRVTAPEAGVVILEVRNLRN